VGDDWLNDSSIIYIEKDFLLILKMRKSFKVFIIWKIVEDNY